MAFTPFPSTIQPGQIERAAFAVISEFRDWNKWGFVEQHYKNYRNLYFNVKAWVVNGLDWTRLRKPRTKTVDDQNSLYIGYMLMYLQEKQNTESRYYFDEQIRRNLNGFVQRLYYSLGKRGLTPFALEEEQESFRKRVFGVIEDSLAEYDYTIKVPSPVEQFAKVFMNDENWTELYALADMCEDENLIAEAEHLRTFQYHTFACPVLQHLSGRSKIKGWVKPENIKVEIAPEQFDIFGIN